jgi:hypothetical protein
LPFTGFTLTATGLGAPGTGLGATATAFAGTGATETVAGFAGAGTTFTFDGEGFEFCGTAFTFTLALLAGLFATVGVCAKATADIANNIDSARLGFIRSCLLPSPAPPAAWCHG